MRDAAPEAKQFLKWRGEPLYWRSAATFARVPRVAGLVFVFPTDSLEERSRKTEALFRKHELGLPWRAAAGGARRQDSVANALACLPAEADRLLVHDAARPFFTPSLTVRLLEALDKGAAGAVPAVPVTDTVKRVRGGLVAETLDRSELAAVQTPQAFDRRVLERAHGYAREHGLAVTDDASMLETMGETVAVVHGEQENRKITTPADLALLEERGMQLPVTGYGYDVHRYGPGRPLKLGGAPIAGGPEVVAHSDGDVLLHALCDAVLGCAGLDDIGRHFPDTDSAWAGVESGVLLSECLEMARAKGLTLTHADLTVIAQTPKISPHRENIRRNVAGLLGLPLDRVNLKATTEEGLGFTGRKEGIKAVAVVTGIIDRA